MTDTQNPNGGSGNKKPPESSTIIDAAVHRRPRVHGAEGAHPEADIADIEFLRDVPLRLDMVLGETTMSLGEVIALEADSIVQLDKLSGDPIDVFVENQKLGKGEVVVLHEKIRIRLLEITPPAQNWKDSKTQNVEEG